jgi:hypothetical protein
MYMNLLVAVLYVAVCRYCYGCGGGRQKGFNTKWPTLVFPRNLSYHMDWHWVVEEPNNTTARKSGPLYVIQQYSLYLGILVRDRVVPDCQFRPLQLRQRVVQ